LNLAHAIGALGQSLCCQAFMCSFTHTHTPSAVAEQPCHDATAALLCPIGKVERKIKKDCYSSSLKCSKCAFREALVSTLIPPKGGREHLTANVPIHGLSCIV